MGAMCILKVLTLIPDTAINNSCKVTVVLTSFISPLKVAVRFTMILNLRPTAIPRLLSPP